MKRIFLLVSAAFVFLISNAQKISGTISDTSHNKLAFASILVKGTTIGTTANSEGQYSLHLKPGKYTIICEHVNYQRQEKTISITDEGIVLNFILSPLQFIMPEVIIKRGEDPAYEIIRKTIKKRKEHSNELKEFTCEVYTKGILKLRNYPKSFMGDKVDFQDGDTSKNKMLYLSESIAKYSVQKPNNQKVEITATKVSGQSNGFGLSAPNIISFYENNIQVGEGLNPRGFVSPIADNALNFYRYHFDGYFFEDGRQIARIKIFPKRKFEPLFSGYINIIEGEWRIHSLELQLTKESQMQLVDTLRIQQLYVNISNAWVVKSQVVYPVIKMFGFEGYGDFVNIYSDYNLHPNFPKKYFDRTILKYDDSSNKKTSEYWNESRPIVLQKEEVEDYRKKDSIEQAHKNPHYLDSVDKKFNQLSYMQFLTLGQTFTNQKKHITYFVPALQEIVNFNTVEGLVIDASTTITKRLDTNLTGRKSFSFTPHFRYGFSNHHFNPSASFTYNFGKKYFSSITVRGGKTVFQFNNANPISPHDNTISSLYYQKNYMKIYEAWFAAVRYSKDLGSGVVMNTEFSYQDRMPLENTTDYAWRHFENRSYTPNYPVELTSQNIPRHQAFLWTTEIRWQPGTNYIELPGRKIDVGSKYPVFTLSYTQGIPTVFSSDVNYSKWKLSVSDNLNFKLLGALRYKLSVGGFLDKKSVFIPDYTHFNGNQLQVASEYLNSFQMAPYYKYSNTESFYTTAHAEYHLNGFLTNKIPLFRRLNWYIVTGSNDFFVNTHNYYAEVFAGLENILKVFRVDLVTSYQPGIKNIYVIRIGAGGIFRR